MIKTTFYVVNIDTGMISSKYTERDDDIGFQWLDARMIECQSNAINGYIQKYGYFIQQIYLHNKYLMLLEDVGNAKEANYISKIIARGAATLVTFNTKKQDEVSKINNILIHNTKDIARIALEKIYSIVDQNRYQNSDDKIQYIEQLIRDNTHNISIALVNIKKYIEQMNFEYTISELLGTNIDLSKLVYKSHKLHPMILLGYYVVSDDFNKNSISYEIDQYDGSVNVHFDSFKTAIVQIFDNCRKYCLPNTKIEIRIQEKQSGIRIYFVMDSVYNTDNEINKMFEYNTRGSEAQKIGKGNGIGMFIVKRMLDLNNCTITFNRLSDPYEKNNTKYCRNSIIIRIPNCT